MQWRLLDASGEKTYVLVLDKGDEQVEVLSLIGDVALDGEEPTLHAHVVVGRADGTAHGGHLLAARVWPTLEVMLAESPRHLHRRRDPDTALALIRL